MTPADLDALVRQAIREELKSYVPPTPPVNDLPDYLTRKQVAELLQVSLTSLHEWVKLGILKPVRINSRVRFRREDIQAALGDPRTRKYARR